MAEVRGNIIQLTGSLMGLYPEAQEKADQALFRICGKHWDEMTTDDWIDTTIWDTFMGDYAAASLSGQNALITLGRNIYPAIRKAGQIPEEIDTPLKMLKFEEQGFLLYHRGDDVKPRNFIRLENKNTLVEALSPGYNCKVIEGVFQGIIEMFGIRGVRVTQITCVKKGGSVCQYHITW